MPSFATFSGRLALFAIAALLATQTFDASAQSKRDRAAAEALNQRMAAAETRYREAMIKIGNNDPEGLAESNAALEDMEDAITACSKQKGCAVSQLLTSYKRLLKADADARATGSEDGDGTLVDDSGELPTGNVPQAAQAASLLGSDDQRFVKMVQFNPAVQAGIRRWLTDMRVSLIQSHENYQYMRHLMSPSFQRSGLPEALLFGILAKESNGRVHAGSRAGASGPLQFMPATGRRFGLGVDATGFDTRYDPHASADAAAAYLNERYAEFGNNIELWLAAYNGGEGRALRAYQNSGGRNFWDESVYNQFPPETKDYVPMVIAAAWLFLHPKEYGIRWPRVSTRQASIRLAQPASIYELTICLGNYGSRDGYMRALRNLNPRWEADTTIPAGSSINATTRIAWLYRFNCTGGKRAQLARQLVASNVQSAVVRVGDVSNVAPAASAPTQPAAPPPPAKPKTYQVQRGENLTGIARKFECNLGDFAKANKLKAPKYAIRPGQTLKLDGCG